MKVFINKQEFNVKDGATLGEILRERQISTDNIAIAVENLIMPKSKWDDLEIEDGSKIIIIKAVQGG